MTVGRSILQLSTNRENYRKGYMMFYIRNMFHVTHILNKVRYTNPSSPYFTNNKVVQSPHVHDKSPTHSYSRSLLANKAKASDLFQSYNPILGLQGIRYLPELASPSHNSIGISLDSYPKFQNILFRKVRIAKLIVEKDKFGEFAYLFLRLLLGLVFALQVGEPAYCSDGNEGSMAHSFDTHPREGADSENPPLTSGELNMRNPSDDSPSAPSALEQRTDELIQENLQERKGDLGDGQRISELRQEVIRDLSVEKTPAEFFKLTQQLEKEAEAKNEPSPVTNCAFNSIKEHEGKIQDGKGGGKPTINKNSSADCSFQEKAKADE